MWTMKLASVPVIGLGKQASWEVLEDLIFYSHSHNQQSISLCNFGFIAEIQEAAQGFERLPLNFNSHINSRSKYVTLAT